MDELCNKSIAELGKLIRSVEVSSKEITQTYLDRITRFDKEINCFISVEADQALKQAEQADKKVTKNASLHPMHGIPIAIKDIFERKNIEVTAGSKYFSYTSDQTATVIKRLQEAGAVILGTLNLDEFAAGGTGANSHFGRCTNPWNKDHITGGSSSGSAAAVCAGLATATLGSDAGGSIRLPAAFCGVTGLKPTYGRVSRFGAIPRTWSMDCIGPLANSAQECAIVLDAIAGKDSRDSTSVDTTFSFRSLQSNDIGSISIGIDDSLNTDLDNSTGRSIDATVKKLTDLGFDVKPVALPNIDQLNDLHQVIVKCEAAAFHGKRIRDTSEELSTGTKSVIQEGFLIPATRYIEALSLRATVLDEFNRQVFNQCDAFLMPVSNVTAPKYVEDDETNPQSIDRMFTQISRFIRFVNYLGIPAISFPTGFDDNGLPIGMQLLGKPWQESLLLSIVDIFQQNTNYHARDISPFLA